MMLTENVNNVNYGEEITSSLINQPLGIFEGDNALLGEDGIPIAPIVRGTITDIGQISGLSFNEADGLSKQLNAGRLPVPLEILYDQTVSPILGAGFIDMSIKAGVIGVIIVMLFMMMYYRLPGSDAQPAIRETIKWVFKAFSGAKEAMVVEQRLKKILKMEPQKLCKILSKNCSQTREPSVI